MSNSLIQQLFPTGKFVLAHLHSNADRLHEMGLILVRLSNETRDKQRYMLVERSKELQIGIVAESRRLFETLSKNLITPFDREDIFAIGSGIKIISSKTDSLIRFIQQNNCDAALLGLTALSGLFQQGIQVLVDLVYYLENISDRKVTFQFVKSLKNIHDEIDYRCEYYMVESFDNVESIKDILVNTDIYAYFDLLSSKLKELGQVAEGLIVKYC